VIARVVSQTIKEVLSHLCSDGLVDSDKIGSGNFFWALPSKAKIMVRTRAHTQTTHE
jgi:hypothetical protein